MDYFEKARKLSEGVKFSEGGQETEYDAHFVRRSVVHTRQDMVLVVSLLDSLNGQLQTLRYLVAGVLLALILILFK